jgi:DNA-binding MarR family transcriptional regulator
MTEKQQIRASEARILVYLSVVHNTRKYVGAIDAKVGNDYSYTMRVLQRMVAMGWLHKHSFGRKMFYDLTPLAPLELARNALKSNELQKDLEDNYTQSELPEVQNEELKEDSETEAAL